MSVFTTVAPDELRAWLGNYAIGPLTALAGIPAGIENTNYFVTTGTGRYVLTLFEKLAAHELPFYLNLMAHLADHGIPCPRPVANRSGALLGELNGKPAAIVGFCAGTDVAAPDAAQCASVGEVLARIHLAGQSYGMTMRNPRGLHWWKSTMPEVLPFLDAADATLLREEVAFQGLFRFPDLPRGAIHADLFRDNVLFNDGRIAGVIDFYFACTDALLYDVAITVNDWCINPDGALDAGRTQALLDGYRSARPFTALEKGAWPVMLRAGALRFWISRLRDLHLGLNTVAWPLNSLGEAELCPGSAVLDKINAALR